ncbi:hypothetical protein TWF694_004642 [Orbilia ellipsospora]|uniref:Uncharacterized protein n=1 Tax=Orbilia ellipsospora TaxID=2528407 RepID=A0AAV9WX61_9PEZI
MGFHLNFKNIFSISLGLSSVVSAAVIPRDSPSYYTRNLNTITSIYQYTIYPNQLPIVAQATQESIPQLANLFSPTVAGRIQDIGNFTDFRTSIEYFFGLAPTPRAPKNGAISAIDITQFSSGCPSVAASTVVFTISVWDDTTKSYGEVLTYLKQSGFWHFNDQGQVDYYDLNIPALGDFTGILQGVDFSSQLVQLLATKEVCAGAQAACTGANTQYYPNNGVSVNSILKSLGISLLNLSLIQQLDLGSLDLGGLNCFAQLTKKPFGDFNKLWSDSVVCRVVHLMLAVIDPVDHCPHVGPTGGMKCVNYGYEDRLFLSDAALFGDVHRFVCPAS